ncbi:MAG TPA: MMPL family transporter, partial [Verrucomicrobiae bacterium]|nr:MMPL family transporter [Verrucomicrobiae bacterium]
MDSPDAKPHSHDTLPTRVLRLLAESVYRNPRLYFYPQVLLFVACIYYTATHLKLNENRNDLVGSDKKYHRNFLKFKAEFPGQDDLVAVVESEDLEKNRQFVERLGQRLVREPALFTDVMFHNDLKMMGKKALLFFSEKDLADFQKTLGEFRPFLETFSQATNLDSLLRLVNRKIRTSKDEKNAENAALVKAIPALERIIAQASDSIRRAGAPPSPGVTALFDAGDEALRRQYITFNKGRMFIVTAHAVTDETEADAVRRLRQLVLETQREVPGVNVAVTGEPVLDFDEMNQSQHDSTVATVVSLVLCALIFIYGYQETG